MSKLDELINKLCPNGVSFKELGDITVSLRKDTLTTDKLIENGKYPVINSGRTFYGFYNEFNNEGDAITVAARGEYAAFVNYSSVRFWAGGLCYPFRSKNDKIITTKFLYYCLKNKEKYMRNTIVTEGSIPALNKTDLLKIKIPVPPMEVQCGIVRILDNFDELQNKLIDEYSKRKIEYNELANRMYKNVSSNCTYRLKEVCKIVKGKSSIQKTEPGEYPMVVTTPERRSSKNYQFDCSAVCIPLISSRGHGVASLNHVYYQSGKFALGNILCAVIPNDTKTIDAKYLYYYFELTKDFTLVPLMKGGANVAMHICDVERVKVPIPPLSEQEKIINALAEYDSYLSNLKSEIKAREIQYEYYRNKLLTFKELES